MRHLGSADRFFWCVIFLAFGCHHATEPSPSRVEPSSQGILPLKVGYYWHYKEYAFNEDSTVGLVIGQKRYRISRVSSSVQQERDTIRLFHWVYWDPYTNIEAPLQWLRTNATDGLYLMGGISPKDTFFATLLDRKYPLGTVDSWSTPHLVYDLRDDRFGYRDTTYYTCVDTSVPFETPIGTFDCVIYHYIEDLPEEDVLMDWEHYEYWAYGVGMVGDIKYNYDPKSKKHYLTTKTVLVETNVPIQSKPRLDRLSTKRGQVRTE